MAVSIKLNITQNSQSVANNTSNVTVKLICTWDYGSYNRNNPPGTVTIDGTTYNFSADINPNNANSGSSTIYSKTLNISHNNEGKKTLNCSATFNTGISSGNLSTSASKVLTTIARKATITEATNFNDEENPSIKYSNPSGSAASTLQAAIYSEDGSTALASYRDISKTGTSYTFSLTDAERNKIRNAMPNSKTAKVRFYVRTILSGSTYTHYVTKSIAIINANPTLNPTIQDVNSVSTDLTKDSNTMIRYISNASVTFGATAVKGATIKSMKVTCGRATLNGDGIINAVESGNFSFEVTDSRGYTTKIGIIKPIIQYVPLTCNLSDYTFSPDGIITMNITGNYFNGGFGTSMLSKRNTLTVQYRYKYLDYTYSNWFDATTTISGNTYSAKAAFGGANYEHKYTIQARAVDLLYTVNSVEPVLSCYPVFDWGAEDFNFNVDVSLANNYRIMGTTTDGQKLNAFQPANQNNNCVIGYGGYDNNIGATHIYGDTVRLYSNNPIELNNKPIGANKLWGGAYYMSEGHTINLAEPVSAQFSGIVLVFSRYDIANGEALNEHFSYHFVPKLVVEEQSDRGSIFNMSTSNETFSASKYLYITDTQIRGHANNVATGTGATGVKYENNRFVLRYVIGV